MIIQFDPVIFHLGFIQIRWYGLMYVISFLIGGALLRKLSKKNVFPVPIQNIDSYVSWQMIGMVLGARLAYVFIYNWEHYRFNPGKIMAVWEGGLSFHGAIIGFIIVNIIYARLNKLRFVDLTDSLALAGSPGLFFGRIGNFINGELFGRTGQVPWAMIFPEGGPTPRHPSQLYEAFLEGILLTLILWSVHKKYPHRKGLCSALFLSGYGFFRFIVEFFREPDPQLGLYFNQTLSMGQILCLLMILSGPLFYWLQKKQTSTSIRITP
jgi:phosphatidylglycerol:prolipoprotein diacylglycerol transferase